MNRIPCLLVTTLACALAVLVGGSTPASSQAQQDETEWNWLGPGATGFRDFTLTILRPLPGSGPLTLRFRGFALCPERDVEFSFARSGHFVNPDGSFVWVESVHADGPGGGASQTIELTARVAGRRVNGFFSLRASFPPGSGAPACTLETRRPVSFDAECELNCPALVTPTPTQPAKCVVPRLAGRKLAAARSALTTARCRVGKIRRVRSTPHRTGRVVGQSPRPGARLPAGSKVDLRIGLGPPR